MGCANIAGLYAPVTRAEAMETLEAAWSAGLRYFDTAPFYGRGLSERRTGDFLRDKPSGSYVLSTKVGRLMRPDPAGRSVADEPAAPLPFEVVYDYSYEGIMRSVEHSYQRLGLPRIDIAYVHDLGRFAHKDAASGHLRTFLNSGVRALEELRKSGEIGRVGLGVNENEVCLDVMAHADLDCILLASRYTLLDRTAEAELIALCRQRGTRLVVGGVFNSGILATGASGTAWFNYAPADDDIRERVDAIETIVARHGLTLAEAALNFPLACDVVDSVLIGTHRAAGLERNLKALGTPLPADMLDEIEPFVLR
nr:aldo/keto reductase [Pelagibacterium montanilacus]